MDFAGKLRKTELDGETNATTTRIAIGNGISIPKDVDDFIKLGYLGAPMTFLKQLIIRGGIFTLEELASHSLKGGKSPRAPDVLREKLDPVKLKAAVGKFIY